MSNNFFNNLFLLAEFHPLHDPRTSTTERRGLCPLHKEIWTYPQVLEVDKIAEEERAENEFIIIIKT